MRQSWGSEESQLNQIGTFIVVIPPLLAALLLWDVIPIKVPVAILFVAVAACGLIGGAINLLGRGPVVAGAIVGLVIALGGFSAVYWWIQVRQSVYWFELAVAFIIGSMPGFLLQRVMKRVVARGLKAGE